MLLLIDNYDSFTYNLVHYIGELGQSSEVHRNDKITVANALSMNPKAIVLSPGPCTPAEAGICLDLIAAAGSKIPILGVCLGHQAIGQHFGAIVKRAPVPMHGKMSTITSTGRGLFNGLPSHFQVTRYHSLIVERETLPPDLDVTAVSEDGLIMALSHRVYPIHGVQFHPESIASEYGYEILANFLTLAGMSPRRRNTTPPRVAA